MTVEQTIDIPVSRKLYLDLPETVPSGRTKLVLNFESLPPQAVVPPERKLSPALQGVLKETAEKRAWRLAHPEDFEARMKQIREGGPLFGGIDGLEYQRNVRSEWEE
jgi:hypothetical protein